MPVPPPVLFHHASSLLHDTGDHPECAARITSIEMALAQVDWLGQDVRESPAASSENLRSVHDPNYLRGIRERCETGGGYLDADTVVSPDSWAAALHAAGGAVALVDALLSREATAGSSLHRPPGHHAEPARAMGFCVLGNAAIAAQHALDAYGLERVAIIDWDVHHGNGTQAIFWEEPRVLTCSLHQFPFWPGTGAASQVGAGPGAGFTVNLPMAAGTGDDAWASMVEHVAVPVARAHRPQLLLLCAGFDAHAEDPLAGCAVTDDGYAAMTASVAALAQELDVPMGLILEGGYDLGVLARCVPQSLRIIGGPAVAPDVPVHPTAEHALLQRTR